MADAPIEKPRREHKFFLRQDDRGIELRIGSGSAKVLRRMLDEAEDTGSGVATLVSGQTFVLVINDD